VSEFLTGQALAQFVLGFEHTAFRLEQRDDRYREAEEDEPLRRFLAGEPVTVTGWNDEWEQMLRRRSECGQRMMRVRVVREPHSDYTRFLLALAEVNVPAGEDIRYLPQDRARHLDLPGHDFWLIDSSRVAILRFAQDDTLQGAEVHDDPAVVVRHCYYRDVASHHAVPFAEYATT
jgi:hypothetical protein